MPHSSVAEDSAPLGCDARCDTWSATADIQKEYTTFMFKGQVGKEDFFLVGQRFLVFQRRAGNHSLNTTSNPRRTESCTK